MLDLPFLMELEMATTASSPSFHRRVVPLYRGLNGWLFYGKDRNRPFKASGHFEEDPQQVISQYPDIFWDGARVLDCENADPIAYPTREKHRRFRPGMNSAQVFVVG